MVLSLYIDSLFQVSANRLQAINKAQKNETNS